MSPKRKAAIGYALIAIGFGMFMAGPIVLIVMGVEGPAIALPAILGFAVIAGGGILLTASSDTRAARLTGREGGIQKIVCPNCGASPTSPATDGTVACEYCGTRFLLP